ncbi:MAG: DUF6538 domain-containing protein [Thiobacillus sp.]
MRLPSHIMVSRHGIFYFRVVLPQDLRPYFGGRREIKRSLATRDPKLAKISAYSLYVNYQVALREAISKMAFQPKFLDPNAPSTFLDSLDRVSQFGVQIEARGLRISLDVDPNKAGDAEAAKLFLRDAILGDPNLPKVIEQASKTPIPSSSIDPSATAKIIKDATEEAVKNIAHPAGNTTGYKLSKAIKNWEVEFTKGNNNTKTQHSYFSVLQRFLDFTGDIAVNAIYAEHIRKYRTHRKSQGRKTATVDGDTKSLGRFFYWARQEGHYPNINLPTANQYELSRSSREKQATGAERFTLEELQLIFSPQLYTAFNTRPHEYWLPLLALFTGARIEELTQLHLCDIYQSDDIPILDLNDLGRKSLKTEASKRKVPIHPILIELGFLDYIADVKIAVADAKVAFQNVDGVFPYLTPTKHERLSDRASKAWGRYLDTLKIIGRDKVFHSFRDTVNNELADRSVTVELRCALVGHDINNANIKQYRDPIPARRLMKEGIGRLRYERKEADGSLIKLDLAPLKYPKGQFVQRLLNCAEEEKKLRAKLAKKTASKQTQQAREAEQKRRPGRPSKEKIIQSESSEEIQARALRLQSIKDKAESNKRRRALIKQPIQQQRKADA